MASRVGASLRRSLSKRPLPSDESEQNRSKRRHLEDDEDDKENAFQPLCRSTPQPNKRGSFSKPDTAKTPWSLRKLLTPIREDKILDESSINVRCLPVSLKASTTKGSSLLRRGSLKRRSDKSQKVVSRLDSYFLSPDRLNGGYVNLDITDDCSQPLLYPLDNTEGAAKNVPQTPKRLDNTMSHVTLKDISHISLGSSPHEQVSSANLTGAFHSTFNYPLHSTFNYPLHSSLNVSKISASEPKSAREAPVQQCPIDIRKYVLNKTAGDEHSPQYGSQLACCCESDSDSDCWSDTDSDVTEIDVDDFSTCDSSFLSDVMDDVTMATLQHHNGNHSLGPNPHLSNSRMMRRQSGLAELSMRSPPTGGNEQSMKQVSGLRPDHGAELSLRHRPKRASSVMDISGDEVWIIKDECSISACKTKSRTFEDSSDWSEHSSDLSARYHFEALNIKSSFCSVASQLHKSRLMSRTLPNHRTLHKVTQKPAQGGHGPRKVSQDSGCSMNSSDCSAYTINDNTGQSRTIQSNTCTNQPTATASTDILSKDRKKRKLHKKLQQFSKSFTRSKTSLKSRQRSKSKGHTSLQVDYGIRV